MAGANLLTLIDDIATLLDDVTILTKIAAKKTAAVLGDDLALNAEQVTGVKAARELPVVWAVFKGAMLNKLILVPAALLISAFIPWAIIPMLMFGGAFLCFEGFEKIAHKFLHSTEEKTKAHMALVTAVADKKVDLVAFEQKKIRGAIRTDFILSAEIIVITLGTVAAAALSQQVIVLCVIALGMTIGVYGLVAGIVKIDDAGLHLSKTQGEGFLPNLTRRFGIGLYSSAPYFMKALSILGTAAMFIVGGGIIAHGVSGIHHLIEDGAAQAQSIPAVGHIVSALTPTLLNTLVGIIVGAVLVGLFTLIKKLKPA